MPKEIIVKETEPMKIPSSIDEKKTLIDKEILKELILRDQDIRRSKIASHIIYIVAGYFGLWLIFLIAFVIIHIFKGTSCDVDNILKMFSPITNFWAIIAGGAITYLFSKSDKPKS